MSQRELIKACFQIRVAVPRPQRRFVCDGHPYLLPAEMCEKLMLMVVI